MAHTFTKSKWSITDTVKFDESLTLLNPTITVRHIVVTEGTVNIGLNITENSGVFTHSSNIRYTTTEADINTAVDDALAAAFPTATKTAIS